MYSDDLYNLQNRDLDEQILDISMRTTYDFIQKWSWDWWEQTTTIDAKRKIRIMKRMEEWFAQREEFEKCQKIVDSYRRIEQLCHQ